MQQLNDGDIYVNPGVTDQLGGAYYPGDPEDRKQAEREAAAPVASSYPIMEEIAEWFKAQIADCNDIHNVQVAEMTINGTIYSRKIAVEAQVLAYQLLKEKLTDKFNTFKDFAKDQDD